MVFRGPGSHFPDGGSPGPTPLAVASDVSGGCWNDLVRDPSLAEATEYRVTAWWTHPGEPLPGGVQLPEGWARSFDVASFAEPHEVATFLRSHPDAWNADVVTFETRHGQRRPTSRNVAEKTIAGWIMSEGALDQPSPELPDNLREVL